LATVLNFYPFTLLTDLLQMKYLDTTIFNNRSNQRYKTNTQTHWTRSPCGSNSSEAEKLSKEYFDEIENDRYSSHPWILDAINNFNLKDKRVLEIGFGMGTDHLCLLRRGANIHGIDLTLNNSFILKERLKIYGFKSSLICGDAENLPIADESMDFIYSFGVIHHSPDTGRIVSEIHRILKPGGKCWITVYNKNSIFFWWSLLLVDWLFKGSYKYESLKERISKIEYPNDNPDLVIKLYTKKQFKKLFSKFCTVDCSVKHLVKRDIFYIGPYIPDRIIDFLSGLLGWYIIIEAVK